jgi:hypothetical protein
VALIFALLEMLPQKKKLKRDAQSRGSAEMVVHDSQMLPTRGLAASRNREKNKPQKLAYQLIWTYRIRSSYAFMFGRRLKTLNFPNTHGSVPPVLLVVHPQSQGRPYGLKSSWSARQSKKVAYGDSPGDAIVCPGTLNLCENRSPKTSRVGSDIHAVANLVSCNAG